MHQQALVGYARSIASSNCRYCLRWRDQLDPFLTVISDLANDAEYREWPCSTLAILGASG